MMKVKHNRQVLFIVIFIIVLPLVVSKPVNNSITNLRPMPTSIFNSERCSKGFVRTRTGCKEMTSLEHYFLNAANSSNVITDPITNSFFNGTTREPASESAVTPIRCSYGHVMTKHGCKERASLQNYSLNPSKNILTK